MFMGEDWETIVHTVLDVINIATSPNSEKVFLCERASYSYNFWKDKIDNS
jgi:hypothetical protein